MPDIRWENNKLIRMQYIFSIFDPDMSATFLAIDKQVLVAPVRTVEIMMGCPCEIAQGIDI